MTKKTIKNAVIYIVSAVLSVLLVWYILYHLFNGFETKIETSPALYATQSRALELDAYIMRDETVLYSKQSGGVNYLFEDGEKVGIGTVVANVYSGTGVQEVTDKIIAIDKKIDILEQSGVPSNITQTDTKNVDDKINELIYIIRDKIEDGDIEYALHKKDELLTLLNKRQVITQNVSGYDEQIVALQLEKNTLTGQLINLEDQVKVPCSGYFYSSIDGYENIFDISQIKNMSIELYSQMVSSEPYDVSTSLGIGKVVNSSEWYVVSEVTKNDLKKFNEGETHSIKFPFNTDIVIDMKIDKIIQTNDSDRVVLVFKTNNMPEGFNYLRKQTVQIIEESYTGYKIPSNAVRVSDGIKGVYILNGNTVRFKEVTVLIEQDGYVIVKEQPLYIDDPKYYTKLGLYDMVITSGKNLYDGKIINNAG